MFFVLVIKGFICV